MKIGNGHYLRIAELDQHPQRFQGFQTEENVGLAFEDKRPDRYFLRKPDITQHRASLR